MIVRNANSEYGKVLGTGVYSMANGVSRATLFILPMLGKRPDQYPRFRDCFLSDPDRPEFNNFIHVFARLGGPNRECYQDEIETLRSDPNYVDDFDDDFDNTYATFIFKIPDEWAADFEKMKNGVPVNELSDEYKAQVEKVYFGLAGRLPWHG